MQGSQLVILSWSNHGLDKGSQQLTAIRVELCSEVQWTRAQQQQLLTLPWWATTPRTWCALLSDFDWPRPVDVAYYCACSRLSTTSKLPVLTSQQHLNTRLQNNPKPTFSSWSVPRPDERCASGVSHPNTACIHVVSVLAKPVPFLASNTLWAVWIDTARNTFDSLHSMSVRDLRRCLINGSPVILTSAHSS